MLRLIFIWLGTIAVFNTDLSGSGLFTAKIFPLFNIFYVLFLFVNFVSFLYRLAQHSSTHEDANIIDLAFEVFSLLYEEISSKYEDKFAFTGRYADFVTDLVVPIEIACVVFSSFKELQLLAYLLN